ncbi:MAG: glycosyltransferase [Fuerstiella sp.]
MRTRTAHNKSAACTERTVLWWSRSGRDYSRDRIIRDAFRSLGWKIHDFRPALSMLGDVEARFRNFGKPDLVWIPCFRQRDAAAAQRWAARNGIPVVFDPLISAWDKQVFERQKFDKNSGKAKRLLRWESKILQNSTRVVADTECHAEFFHQSLNVSAGQTFVIPVSAEEALFPLQPHRTPAADFHVLFYGSFIGLQGPQFIAQAAVLAPEIKWTFIGNGPLLNECTSITEGLKNVNYISRVPYKDLAGLIGQADLLCGVFGTSAKAGRVIPNKVYQALACGRCVVTRSSNAYPDALTSLPPQESGIVWVKEGSATELAAAVRIMAGQPKAAIESGSAARATFERHFCNNVVLTKLNALLQSLGLSIETSTAIPSAA